MGPHQTKKILHSEGKYQQNKRAAYWMGEDICKWYVWKGANIQNTQMTHTTHIKKKKKIEKSGQRTWISISPKKTTEGQVAHEKMFSITHHQGNADQNHNETSFQICQGG